MLTFWIICALMVVFTLWFVLPPLLQRKPEANSGETRAANLFVYQDQHRELEADLKTGLLSEEQYQKDREELERRLLEDVSSADEPAAPARSGETRKLAYIVAIVIPIAAILFYLYIGNPKAIQSPPANIPASGSR